MKKIFLLINTLILLTLLSGCSVLFELAGMLEKHELKEYTLESKEEYYLFEFKIVNHEGTNITSSGSIDILIQDFNKEEKLYEKTLTFSDTNSVKINKDEIKENSISVGYFNFNIHTSKIEENDTLQITQLPTSDNNSNTFVESAISNTTFNNNKFNFKLTLLNDKQEKVHGFGYIDIKIIDDNNNEIFKQTYEFNESQFTQGVVNKTINKEQLKSTEYDDGIIYATVRSEEFNFELNQEINNLQNDNKIDIEGIIEESSSTFAKEDIIDNNWGERKTSTQINNMVDMYEELEEAMKEFMLGQRGFQADSLVSLDRNCFVILDTSKYDLSQIFVYEVMSAVLYDNPIFYYVDKSFSTVDKNRDGLTDTLYLYVADEYINKTDRENYNILIENYIMECIKMLSDTNNDLEKTLLLHDKIVEAVDYDYRHDIHSFNILGVIAEEGPVCESYSETYSFLLNYFNIPCYYVSGYAGENHAWNLIYLNNNWYWVDTTWNDTGNGSYTYEYFGMANAKFLKNRTITDNGIHIINNSLHYMIEIPEASNVALDISSYR